jgi:Flp pilus assembly protein TadG
MTQQQSSLPERQRLLRRVGSERGATLVESALVTILLLTLLFGIVGFGHALYTYHFVANTAREATRWASVRGAKCSGLAGGCPADMAGSDVQTFVTNYSTGIGLDPTKITATTTYLPSPSLDVLCPYTVSPSQFPEDYPGCVVQVQVVYSYNFIFPLLPTSPFNMQSTSQMVISQ